MGVSGPTTESVPIPTSAPKPAPGASNLPDQPKATPGPDPGLESNPAVPSVADPGSNIDASPTQGGDSGKSSPQFLGPPSVDNLAHSNQQAPSIPSKSSANEDPQGGQNQPAAPSNPGLDNQVPKGSDPSQNAPHKDPAANKNHPVIDPNSQNAPAGNQAPSGNSRDTNVINQQPTTINLAPAFSMPSPTTQNNFSPSIGNLIYNAFNPAQPSPFPNEPQASPAAATAQEAAPSPTPTVLTIANQPVTVSPVRESQHVVISSTTLKPGGSGITLSGTPITMDSSYNLIIGSAGVKPASPSNIAPAFSGIMNSPAANALSGPGGNSPAAANPPVGVAPAFAGVMSASVASHEAFNPAATANPVAAAPMMIAGETVVPNPTGFLVAGMTVSPGAVGVTVSGTPVQLASGGLLVVGGSSTMIPALTSVSGLGSVAPSSGTIAGGSTAASGSGSAGGVSSGGAYTGSSSNASTSAIVDATGGSTGSSPSSSSRPSTSPGASASHAASAGVAMSDHLAERYLKGLVVVQVIVVIIICA